MKLAALNLSLCRVPAFSLDAKLASEWPILKAKIKTSSPTFYEQIANIEVSEIGTLPEKVLFTVWKYFNRAKYRATPFADFASYSLVPVGNYQGVPNIAANMQNHQFINWQMKEMINTRLKFKQCNLLSTNSSVYQVENEIRYLKLSEGTFELAAVEAFPELTSLINFCQTRKSKSSIYEYMNSVYQLGQKQCKNLILQLMDLELLLSDASANITGADYFTRLKHPPANQNEHYIIAERKLITGGLDRTKTKAIAEAICFVAKHLPKQQNNELMNFKKAFLKKFEHEEVSLAVALDPELGIGYGNFAQYEQMDDLVENLSNSTTKEPLDETIQYTAMHQFLINGLMKKEPIALEEFHAAGNANILPNTLSVIGHFYQNNLVLANAGGCTANALMGRFSLGNPQLAKHCQDIAKLEQNANPNTIFFDIAYQAETHIDNVNRRANCYNQELPILSWSCLESPLDFNDIMVTVQSDDVVLFSKKLGKRLVPRLASAYNYSRSDLAAYRFLCDLQHQSIQSNLTLDIQKYFPGLDHYPRVNYKQVILSPAKWLIPKAIYQQKNTNELSFWLKQKNINFLIKAGRGDQTLCFDPNSSTDLVALLQYCKQQGDGTIYIYEALIDKEDCINDENGKKYVAEFVINYSHDMQIYSGLQPKELALAKYAPIKKQFHPGSEWIYFEIYLNPSKSNILLCNEIDQLLKVYKNEIKQWFFIRYNDNGKHLRLRLRLKSPNILTKLLNDFNQLLEPLQTKGIITEVILKTYNREVARYGAARMIDVEQFFYLDSKYVLSLLTKPLPKNTLYQQALLFLDKITSICFPLVDDRVLFAKEMADFFAIEFKINPEGFKKVNQTYKVLQQSKSIIVPQTKYNLKPLCDQAQIIFAQCIESEKSKMLADLIHMHINRLFNDHQRLEEAICYQFLYKQLLTERARSVEQSEHQFSA